MGWKYPEIKVWRNNSGGSLSTFSLLKNEGKSLLGFQREKEGVVKKKERREKGQFPRHHTRVVHRSMRMPTPYIRWVGRVWWLLRWPLIYSSVIAIVHVVTACGVHTSLSVMWGLRGLLDINTFFIN